MKLPSLPLTDLLSAFMSPNPAPGGGSASALAGAVGASLLSMVARLPAGGPASPDNMVTLAGASTRCAALSAHLAALMDRESDAYDLVVAAFRLPKSTDAEKVARVAAIDNALRVAMEAPLEIMRTCREALDHAALVARLGNRTAASDLRIGLELLATGVRGGKLNVDANLASIQDAAFAADARNRAERLVAEAEIATAAARSLLEHA